MHEDRWLNLSVVPYIERPYLHALQTEHFLSAFAANKAKSRRLRLF